MPEQRLFPEFRDQYEGTRYPFIDTATLQTRGGELEIDQDLFIDATLHPIGSNGGYLYISNVFIAPREITLSIADSTRREKASVTFDPLFAPSLLRVHDAWERPAGVLVSDALRLSRFSSWPPGDHQFTSDATQFVPSCVIPTPEVGVRGLLTEKGELFTKDVMIIGENGVVLRQEGDDVIRVDMVGDPLFRRRLCEPIDLFQTPNFIRTINGCVPDADGNFNLTVGDHHHEQTIVRIYKGPHGLVIEAIGTTVQRLNE